jgi:hypothetical protein
VAPTSPFSEEEIEKAAAAILKAMCWSARNEINLNATLRFLQIARMYGCSDDLQSCSAEDFRLMKSTDY